MTLNIENFDKLFGYVDALPDDGLPRSWSILQCFGGIVAFELQDGTKGSVESALRDFLGTDTQQTSDLFSMYSYRDGKQVSRMDEFEDLSAAKQKVVLLDVLRTLRQEGRVAWDKAFTLVTDGAV